MWRSPASSTSYSVLSSTSGTLAWVRTLASGGSKLTLALPAPGLGTKVITTDL